jgi:integrase
LSPNLRSKSFAGYLQRHVIPGIGEVHLRQLRPHHIEALLDDLQHGRHLSPKSCNDIRASIHRVFAPAAERGRWQGPNPVARVKRRPVPKRGPPPILRAHEVPAFLAAAGEWRPLMACAVWMGLRRGEVLALRKQDVNLEDRTMVIGRSHGADTTKGGHADVLPVPKPLVRYLARAMKDSDSELLFPDAQGERRSPHTNLKAIVKRSLRRRDPITLGFCRQGQRRLPSARSGNGVTTHLRRSRLLVDRRREFTPRF